MSLFRDLGIRGSLVLLAVASFAYLSISHGISEGWVSACGYLLAGAGLIAVLTGVEPDGAINGVLGVLGTLLTVIGFMVSISQSVEISSTSFQDFGQISSCRRYDAVCRQAALKRGICGQMLSAQVMDQAVASVEVGLSAPKEISPFLDDAGQRDLRASFPNCLVR